MSDSVPNCKHSLQKLKIKSLYLTVWKHFHFPFFCIVFRFPVQFKSNPVVFQLFPESDTQVERKIEILRISNFCFSFHTFPYIESYGSIHALPCMESYDSMRGIAWRVCRSWFHAWNRKESCGSHASMELHGSLMNLGPGICFYLLYRTVWVLFFNTVLVFFPKKVPLWFLMSTGCKNGLLNSKGPRVIFFRR